MTAIKPFKAVYYNSKKTKDLSKVVCPPYDVINSEEQASLASMSPNNFIHVLLNKEKRNDDRKNNRYTRARKIYDGWLKKDILKQDDTPCIYFYRQEYKLQGQKHHRLGFISLMKLQDEDHSQIYPHENTHSEAIEDRLRLWRNLKSNLSSIFVCFSDQHKKVESIFNKHVMSSEPIIELTDSAKVFHRLWRLADPKLIQDINQTLSNQQLFIADGHHRYKVAMEFRRIRMRKKTSHSDKDPFNYVMTYFTNMDSNDLKILPMHRIIKKIPKKLDFLEEFFRIDKVSNKEELMILLAKAGRNEHAYGFYSRKGIKLLRLKNKLLIDKYVKEGSSDFKNLDATILKHFVLDRIGVKSDDIIYTNDLKESTSMVDRHKAEACFIMNPVKIAQLKAIALNGERMPPKTTYFYPKVLSGLTVYKMD